MIPDPLPSGPWRAVALAMYGFTLMWVGLAWWFLRRNRRAGP